MTQDETNTKTLKRYMTVNWKSEAVGCRRTEPTPGEMSPQEFAIPVSIEIVVPEIDIPELSARIEVPQANVESDMMAEVARQGDPAAWKEEADKHIARAVEDHEDMSWDLVYQLTGQVLTRVDVVADPDQVKGYIQSKLREAFTPNEASA